MKPINYNLLKFLPIILPTNFDSPHIDSTIVRMEYIMRFQHPILT